MKPLLLFVYCLALARAAEPSAPAAWSGLDETVVKRIATESGRPPQDPIINTDQGDLLLFLFLTAGAVGGFVAGWSARSLFGKRSAKSPCSPS